MRLRLLPFALSLLLVTSVLQAQTGPTSTEINAYTGLHRAAYFGEADRIKHLVAKGSSLEATDSAGRTAVHVAAYASQASSLGALAAAGADLNAIEDDQYDVVTIAAVANDLALLKLALELCARAGNTTSPYQGTALIAAAHLGHAKVVHALIEAGAPLDHVNNLGWTALIEAVILGDGGPAHIETVQFLVEAGANRSLTDRGGHTPLSLARTHGHKEIASLLE